MDYLTTIVQNSVEDGTYDDLANITKDEIQKLHHWTIDIPYGMSLEEYIERLQVATVALAQPAQQVMLKASQKPHTLLHNM